MAEAIPVATPYTGEVIPLATPYTGEVVLTGSAPPRTRSVTGPSAREAWERARSEGTRPAGTEAFGAVFDPLATMASSIVAKPVRDAAVLGLAVPAARARFFSGEQGSPENLEAIASLDQDMRDLEQMQRAMTYTPRTSAGALSSNPLNAIPAAIGAGLEYIIPDQAQLENSGSVLGMGRNALREAIPQALAVLGVKYAQSMPAAVENMQKAASRRLMRSALKPVVAAQKSGAADTAVQTMLDYGVNVTSGGVQKLRDLIDGLNDRIGQTLQKSPERIEMGDVLGNPAIPEVRASFANQVDPFSDIAAVEGVTNRFRANPAWGYVPETGVMDMPIQSAQALKQGTYRVLGKKYGQMGTAETEAQKALARALKESISMKEPSIGLLNAEESALIQTLGVAERRVLSQMNNNPVGIAGLAHNPAAFAGMLLDKSSLFKSLLARMLNRTSELSRMSATVPATVIGVSPLAAISRQPAEPPAP